MRDPIIQSLRQHEAAEEESCRRKERIDALYEPARMECIKMLGDGLLMESINECSQNDSVHCEAFAAAYLSSKTAKDQFSRDNYRLAMLNAVEWLVDRHIDSLAFDKAKEMEQAEYENNQEIWK